MAMPMGYLFELGVHSAAFGVATGVASLVSETRCRWVAITGVVLSALTYLIIMAMVLFGMAL